MPESKSCDCLDRVAKARTLRREAEEARRRAVENLHRAVSEAISASDCSHSHRTVAKAAGLSLGGLHNARLTVGLPDVVASELIDNPPAPILEARRAAQVERATSEDEPPLTGGALASAATTRRETPAQPRTVEGEAPVNDPSAPVPKARRARPAKPAPVTKSSSGTMVVKVQRYARRPGDRRAVVTRPGVGEATDKLEHAATEMVSRKAGSRAPLKVPPTVHPAPMAKPSRSLKEHEQIYSDVYPATSAQRPPVRRRQRPPRELQRSGDLYPDIY
jgi:hypothetical protein